MKDKNSKVKNFYHHKILLNNQDFVNGIKRRTLWFAAIKYPALKSLAVQYLAVQYLAVQYPA